MLPVSPLLFKAISNFFLEILIIVLFFANLSSKYLSMLGKEKNEKIIKILANENI